MIMATQVVSASKCVSKKVAFLGLGVMGYPMAGYLARAGAGELLPEPFDLDRYAQRLQALLEDDDLRIQMSNRGSAYGRSADIFDLPERATRQIVEAAQAKARTSA